MDMAEENRREGTQIELVRRELYPETRRTNDHRDYGGIVMQAIETPREAFEILFPRYQIRDYRSINLGLGSGSKFKFFSHHRWSGLSIDGSLNAGGTIQSIYRTKIRRALRHTDRRSPEILGEEAYVILSIVLPKMQDFYRSLGKGTNWQLAKEELAVAFENLRNRGEIR